MSNKFFHYSFFFRIKDMKIIGNNIENEIKLNMCVWIYIQV